MNVIRDKDPVDDTLDVDVENQKAEEESFDLR